MSWFRRSKKKLTARDFAILLGLVLDRVRENYEQKFIVALKDHIPERLAEIEAVLFLFSLVAQVTNESFRSQQRGVGCALDLFLEGFASRWEWDGPADERRATIAKASSSFSDWVMLDLTRINDTAAGRREAVMPFLQSATRLLRIENLEAEVRMRGPEHDEKMGALGTICFEVLMPAYLQILEAVVGVGKKFEVEDFVTVGR